MMKVFLAATVLLILVGGGYSVPLETGTDEEGVPSDSYLQEVQEQLEKRWEGLEGNQDERATRREGLEDNQDERTARREGNQDERVARSVPGNSDAACNSTLGQPVRHGSKVAFRAFYGDVKWLGCSTTNTRCENSQCPRMYMEGQDWNTCRQNVFQIFRAQGHGDVKVGDLVGLYLTRESGKWFTCDSTCRKSGCPSIASYEHGFDAPEKWYRCYGSVFKIYARGKQLGETICDRDHIMLFYLQALNWIGADSSNHHRTCPGSTRPPPPSKYDRCGGEIYEIWKK